jgi:phosphoribosylaminoimidazolecarboxamide formyltransferase/IMP cyclohydrolase
MKVRRALVSVHDKAGWWTSPGSGSAGRGDPLHGRHGQLLRDSGVPVRDVSEVTGFPEMLDGRVKTLHPKIHGGIWPAATSRHLEALAQHGIPPIDLVVVALYRSKRPWPPRVTLAEAIEQIDVGGPTMTRGGQESRQRRRRDRRRQYRAVLDELRASGGELARPRVSPGAGGVPAHRPVRRGDRRLPALAGGGASAPERQPDEFPHPLRLEAERS